MALATWNPGTPTEPGSMADRTIARLLRSQHVDLASASRRIEQGLPFRVFVELCRDLGLSHSEFARLLRVSESTLYRRKATGRFEAPESDRLWRYVVLYARAVEVLEGSVAAVEWLHAPAAALAGGTPLNASRDGPGAQRALALLGRIEYGVFG